MTDGPGTGFKLNAKQLEARALVNGLAIHCMLLGGSRSSKTFFFCRQIAIRAMKAPGSRHAILRFRFNAVKTSVWFDTWPKMMKLCFPDAKVKYNKSDWFAEFDNGSQIWFGGLDDKERTEKILGQEYATVFLNECSQISYYSQEIVKTRLAQLVAYENAHNGQTETLRLKIYYDENPPLKTHWTHKLFIEHREAVPPHKPLEDPENYVWLRINPRDNAENLPPEYLKLLQNMSPQQRERFWDGLFGSADENALWTYEILENCRVKSYPDLQRIVVSVDPSGTKGEDDKRSDHVGIVVAGLGIDGEGYILEDLTVRARPAIWGKAVCKAYERWDADQVIGEINFGGAMVEHTIKAAASQLEMRVSYQEVRATRGKVIRAEPVSTLYEQGKVHHVGIFAELEDQLCSFTTQGYMGERSPDRGDAAIWGLTALFPGLTRKSKKDPKILIESAGSYNAHAF